MKKLKNLIDTNYDIDIYGVCEDSRSVKKGYIFVATKGYNVDHFDYINDAISNGAVFLVVDREIDIVFPHIVVDNIHSFYIELCRKFYDININKLKLIGITGTDGKTTTTTIIHRLMDNCCYIGTNGLQINDLVLHTSNTTPCISELYNDLSIALQNGAESVSMEVSSEALLHKRIEGLKFDVVGFTNITGDHLNVHKSMDNYISCKKSLLGYLKDDGLVFVNGDDDNLKSIKCNNLITFGFNEYNDYVICDVVKNNKFTKIFVKGNNNVYELNSPLFGLYNVYNVVMAFLICLHLGVSYEVLVEKIKELTPVSGRCEFLDFGQDYSIVLDYAHTINGIKNILKSFKDYNRIITVTGCAGGREHKKRSVIGDIVMSNSDISIFTMDDPRYEDVNDIIDEMVGSNKDYIRIVDREEAIKYALGIAGSGDVVLILGKGRDNYMAIEDKKIPYSDYEVVKKYFKKD